MKKLFYIVLVIVALMVISRFVKENGRIASTTPAVETSDPVTATLPDPNCICDSVPACDPADENCNSDATKSICKCTQANGETITIEQDVEEVVEINPSETSDEDETFVEESVVSEAETIKASSSNPAPKQVEKTK